MTGSRTEVHNILKRKEKNSSIAKIIHYHNKSFLRDVVRLFNLSIVFVRRCKITILDFIF